jgi:hypothetical protein
VSILLQLILLLQHGEGQHDNEHQRRGGHEKQGPAALKTPDLALRNCCAKQLSHCRCIQYVQGYRAGTAVNAMLAAAGLLQLTAQTRLPSRWCGGFPWSTWAREFPHGWLDQHDVRLRCATRQAGLCMLEPVARVQLRAPESGVVGGSADWKGRIDLKPCHGRPKAMLHVLDILYCQFLCMDYARL